MLAARGHTPPLSTTGREGGSGVEAFLRYFKRNVCQLGIIELTYCLFFIVFVGVGSYGSTCLPGRVFGVIGQSEPKQTKNWRGKGKSQVTTWEFLENKLSNNPFFSQSR